MLQDAEEFLGEVFVCAGEDVNIPQLAVLPYRELVLHRGYFVCHGLRVAEVGVDIDLEEGGALAKGGRRIVCAVAQALQESFVLRG